MIKKTGVPQVKLGLFVYVMDSSITNEKTCGATCYYDRVAPCQFYVFSGGVCYLGNFEMNKNLAQFATSSVDIFMNTGT
jgi:hypothetical protein